MFVQWILDLERQGYAPTHSQLHEMALRISLNSNGPNKIVKTGSPVSLNATNFYTKIGRNMDALRVKGTEKERNVFRAVYSATLYSAIRS